MRRQSLRGEQLRRQHDAARPRRRAHGHPVRRQLLVGQRRARPRRRRGERSTLSPDQRLRSPARQPDGGRPVHARPCGGRPRRRRGRFSRAASGRRPRHASPVAAAPPERGPAGATRRRAGRRLGGDRGLVPSRDHGRLDPRTRRTEAGVISFRGFGKSYGRNTAVAALDLAIEPGEAVALLGPNGSGKTTTLKAAAGLLRPGTGEVLVGRPPRPATEPQARSILSYLPQRVSFPETLTGREVVEFYRRLRNVDAGRTTEVLKFASLNGAGDRAVGTYSGGMAQRLGLAVAMLPEAPVLLLDEPTAALDPDGLCAFYGVVERHRRQGQTILFTSHQLGDAERLADRMAILVEGRLVAQLTARALAERLSDRGILR